MVSIPSRGFWFFEGGKRRGRRGGRRGGFQSPRGDFGFLKRDGEEARRRWCGDVSIPSRGFWFFEGDTALCTRSVGRLAQFQSPRGDFGFLKANKNVTRERDRVKFQSPRGDFGFLKGTRDHLSLHSRSSTVSIPSRGFWFFELQYHSAPADFRTSTVSIPSRGFWFFEETRRCIT